MTDQAHDGPDIGAAMADLAAQFAWDIDADAVLDRVAAYAVDLIAEVDFADVLLIDGDKHRSLAPTSALAAQLDTAQIEVGEGPCLTAAVADSMVCCPDLRTDARWPRFSEAAVRAGVRAMMSVPGACHEFCVSQR